MIRGLVLLLLLITGAAWGTNLPVKRYALFVGANQGGSSTQPLLYAQKDAQKMDQVMQEVGGVALADRLVLLDPTPEGVKAALTSLASRIVSGPAKETRRTEFLFYYSGHSDENGLLLGGRSLPYKALREGLQAVPADVRIAILDSCSSGAFARLKGGVQRAPFLEQDSSQMKGHAFLTSSSDTEASQESDTLEGSFFTHYLVSGLRGGADMAGDGLITLNEAYQYAFQNTLARTESTQAGPQHPSYEIQLSGTGDLILSDVQDSNSRLKIAADVSGKLYVRNKDGVLTAEVTKDQGTPLFLALPAGNYAVTAVTPQKSRVAKVALAAKGVATVSTLDFQDQDLARFATRGGTMVPAPFYDTDRLVLDLSSFTLGVTPGASRADWEEADKNFGFSILVDSARSIRGVQMAGLMAINRDQMDGVQAAGVGTLNHGEVHGLQAAGVFAMSGADMKGAQISGVFNMALGRGIKSSGFQGSGVFNLAQGTFHGFQSAGWVNLADGFSGLQAAPVNVGGDVRGMQIGVVNINSHFEGAGLGLINISPQAYYHPMVLWDSQGNNHALFQWGMGWLYLVVGGVLHGRFGEANDADPLMGAGIKFEDERWFWDTDAGWLGHFDRRGKDPVTGEENPPGVRGHPYLRSTLGMKWHWVAIEGGLMVDPSAPNPQPTWYGGLRLFP